MNNKKRIIQSKYNQTYKNYDVRYEKIQEEKIKLLLNEINSHVKFNKDKISRKFPLILDVGCGTSVIYNKINNFFPNTINYIAIDFSIEMLKYGRRRFLNDINFRKSHLSFILADAEYLPLKENTFDIIISLTVIQNLPNPSKFFEEIKKIINKKFAYLLISLHKKFFSIKEVETYIKQYFNNRYKIIDSRNIEDFLVFIRIN